MLIIQFFCIKNGIYANISSNFFLLRIVLYKAYYLIPDYVKNACHTISYMATLEKMLIMLFS